MSSVHAHIAGTDGRSWAEVDFFAVAPHEVYLEVYDGSSDSRDSIGAVAVFTPGHAMQLARALEDAAKRAGYASPSS